MSEKMNRFNEILRKDLDTVFLNLGELADVHTVGDREVPCVLDIVTFTGKQASFTMHSRNAQYTSEMLQMGDRVLYIRDKEFKARPKKDQRLDIDENPYIVLDVRENRGLYEIHLRDIKG